MTSIALRPCNRDKSAVQRVKNHSGAGTDRMSEKRTRGGIEIVDRQTPKEAYQRARSKRNVASNLRWNCDGRQAAWSGMYDMT